MQARNRRLEAGGQLRVPVNAPHFGHQFGRKEAVFREVDTVSGGKQHVVDLAPVPLRGRRNTPANVIHTLNLLAQLREVEPAALAATIERNAKRVFALP